MKPRGVTAVADVLSRVVRTLDIEAKLLSHSVEPAWPRAVGDRLAPNSRAVKLRDGVLTVEARSASWVNELSLLRDSVRERLNQELAHYQTTAPLIREIRLRLGGGFAPIPKVPSKPHASDSEIEAARAALADAGITGAEIAARAYALRKKVS